MEVFSSKNKSGTEYVFVSTSDLALHEKLIQAGFKRMRSSRDEDENTWYRPLRGFNGFWQTDLVPESKILWPNFESTSFDIQLFAAKLRDESVVLASGEDAGKLTDIGFRPHKSGMYFLPMREMGPAFMRCLKRFPNVRMIATDLKSVAFRSGARHAQQSSTDSRTENEKRTSTDKVAHIRNLLQAEALSLTPLPAKDDEDPHQLTLRKIEAGLNKALDIRDNKQIERIEGYYVEQLIRPFIFDINMDGETGLRNDDLKAILGEDIDTIAKETLRVALQRYIAHYPSPYDSSCMTKRFTQTEEQTLLWDIARTCGFSGGTVLVPSLSYGMLIRKRPEDMTIRVIAFEPLPMLAEIYRRSYPEMEIVNDSPDRVSIRRAIGACDLIIGGFDYAFDRRVHQDDVIHRPISSEEKQLLQCLRYLKPGGLAVLNLSTAFLDNVAPDVRGEIARHCELGALRTRFQRRNVDLVVLRKRLQPIPMARALEEPWVECGLFDYIKDRFVDHLSEVEASNYAQAKKIPFFINRYFKAHPDRQTLSPALISSDRLQITIPTFLYTREDDNDTDQQDDDTQVEKRRQRVLDWAKEIASEFARSRIVPKPTETVQALRVPVQKRSLRILPGCHVVHHDQLMCLQQDGSVAPANIRPKRAIAILKDAVRLRDVVIAHINLEIEHSDTASDVEALRRSRQRLLEAYQSFRDKHGALQKPDNRSAILRDPLGYLVLSLERVRERNGQKIYEPAEIFHQRIIAPRSQESRDATQWTESRAVLESLIRFGDVNLPWITEKLGARDTFEAGARLIATRSAFIDPEIGAWVDGPSYLSGNVRRKLKIAMDNAERDPLMRCNVEALESVLPDWVPFEYIDIDPSAKYIAPQLIESFLSEKNFIQSGAKLNMRYDENSGKWRWNRAALRQAVFNTPYCTSEKTIDNVLACVLNHASPTVTTAGKIDYAASMAFHHAVEQFKKDFKEWIAQNDARRESVETTYNHLYNASVPKRFPEEASQVAFNHSITSKFFKPRPTQTQGILRILTDDHVLIAHEMGTGKTALMLAAAIQLKRIQPDKLNLIVVPENILDRVMMECAAYFPGGRFLIPVGKESEKKFLQDYLKKVVKEGAEFDAVIVTQAMFKNIPMLRSSVKHPGLVIQNALAAYDVQAQLLTPHIYRANKSQKAPLSGEPRTIFISIDDSWKRKSYFPHLPHLRNDLRKVHPGFQAAVHFQTLNRKLGKELRQIIQLPTTQRKDDMVYLEDLNLGAVFYDEIHLSKKIPLDSSIRGLGLPTDGDSALARDLLNKLDQLRTRGVKIVGLTGTPINNSIAEIYVNKRLIDPGSLYRNNIYHFDEWLSIFADTETLIERDPAGDGYRPVTRFSKIRNATEMMHIFGGFADIAFLEHAATQLPDRKDIQLSLDRHPILGMHIQTLVARYRTKAREKDNILWIMHDGYAASQDLRLAYEGFPKLPCQTKVDPIIANLYREWLRTRDVRGTQILFLDIGTPKHQKANLFEEIRQSLVKLGVPASEILLSSDWMRFTGQKRITARAQALQQFRTGQARMLIGTTSAIGIGIDAPDRVTAIHLADPTFRPDQMEQRIRRGVRPGNRNDTVQVFYYVQKRSMDEFYWQTVQRKAKFIRNMFRYDANARHLEDRNQIPYEDLLAIATENPLLKERYTVENRIHYLKATLRDQETKDYLQKKRREELSNEIQSKEQHAQTIAQRIKFLQRWRNSPSAIENLVKIARHAAYVRQKQLQEIRNNPFSAKSGEIRISKHVRMLSHVGVIHIAGQSFWIKDFIQANSPKKMAALLEKMHAQDALYLNELETSVHSLRAKLNETQSTHDDTVQKLRDELDGLRKRLADIDIRIAAQEQKSDNGDALDGKTTKNENETLKRLYHRIESKKRFLAM